MLFPFEINASDLADAVNRKIITTEEYLAMGTFLTALYEAKIYGLAYIDNQRIENGPAD
jgi:hypothetical protein